MKLTGFWLVYQPNCVSDCPKGLYLVLIHTRDPSCPTTMCPAGKSLGEVKILTRSLWVALTLHFLGSRQPGSRLVGDANREPQPAQGFREEGHRKKKKITLFWILVFLGDSLGN